MPASPQEDDDAKSDVSSLKCGSCPPDPNYNPAKDPFLPGNATMCDPPAIIEVCMKIQPQAQMEEMTKPEWLETPEEKKKRKKAEKKAKKLDKKKNLGSHRRSKSMFSMSGQHDDVLKPELVQRSFSEESAPTAVLKNTNGHRRTVSSPMPHRIVLGKDGRPIYEHQAEAEDEQDAVEDDIPSLSSLKELEHVNYDDFKPRADSAGGDAIDPATSFTDSYQTHPTLYESSSEHQRQHQTANTNISSPRKGMVRREFQRRFFFFKKNNSTPAEQPAAKMKASSKKDKTAKTANSTLAEWKQSPSSCMV
jgi:hypothetical protein